MTTSSNGDLLNTRVDNLLSLFTQQNKTYTQSLANVYSVVNSIEVSNTGITTFTGLSSYYTATKLSGGVYTIISNTGLYSLIATYIGPSTFVSGKYSTLVQLTNDVNNNYFTDGIVFINSAIYIINSSIIIPIVTTGGLVSTAISNLSVTDNGILNASWLQTAVNAGGTITITNNGTNPIYKLADTTYLYSNTKLVIDPGVTLQAVTTSSTTPFNIFTNINSAATPQNIVSITPTEQTDTGNKNGGFLDTLTIVFSSTPTCVVGNYIFLKGDSTNVYNGIVKVLTVSGNTITTELSGLNGSSFYNYVSTGIVISGTVSTSGTFIASSTSAAVELLGKTVTGPNLSGSGVTKITSYGIPGGHANYNTNLPATSTTTNSYTFADHITATIADINIEITGGGIINGNFTSGGFVDTNSPGSFTGYQNYHGILLNNIKDPNIHNLYFHDVYGDLVCIANAINPYVSFIKGNTGGRGIHYIGPIFGNAVIDNIVGFYGNDVASFELVPPANMVNGIPINSGGSFYNGGTISNVKAITDAGSSLVSIYTAASTTNIDNYVRLFGMYNVSNIDTLLSSNMGYKTSATAFKIDSLYTSISNSSINDLLLGNINGNISLAPNYGNTTVNNVVISNHIAYTEVGSSLGCITVNNAAINKLTIYNPVIYSNPTQTFTFGQPPQIYCNSVSNTASIINLIIQNPVFNVLEGFGVSLIGGNGGTINSTTVYNPTTGNSNTIATLGGSSSSLAGTPKLIINNIDNISSPIITLSGTQNLDIKLVGGVVSNTPFNFSTTNTVNIWGNDVSVYGTIYMVENYAGYYPNISFRNWQGNLPPVYIYLDVTPSFYFLAQTAYFFGKSKTIATTSIGATQTTATLNLPSNALDGEVYEIEFITPLTTLIVQTTVFIPNIGTGVTTLSFNSPVIIPNGSTLFNSSGSLGVTISYTGSQTNYNLSGPITFTGGSYWAVGGNVLNKFNAGSIPSGFTTSLTYSSTLGQWI